MLSVIIPTFKRNADLEKCLDSLRKNSQRDLEIIVLHPKLDPETDAICEKFAALSVNDESRRDGKRVKSLWGIINFGIDLANNRYVCWLNDDCLVLPDWDVRALAYFTDDPRVGLLVLRTKGILQNPEFLVATTDYGTLVANYGVLDRETGLRFDERFNWFYGDVDLPMQFARDTKWSVVGSRENMVIHNHVEDDNRQQNETDPRSIADNRYFKAKWWPYKLRNGRLVRKNIVEYLKIDRAVRKLYRVVKKLIGAA